MPVYLTLIGLTTSISPAKRQLAKRPRVVNVEQVPGEVDGQALHRAVQRRHLRHVGRVRTDGSWRGAARQCAGGRRL